MNRETESAMSVCQKRTPKRIAHWEELDGYWADESLSYRPAQFKQPLITFPFFPPPLVCELSLNNVRSGVGYMHRPSIHHNRPTPSEARCGTAAQSSRCPPPTLAIYTCVDPVVLRVSVMRTSNWFRLIIKCLCTSAKLLWTSVANRHLKIVDSSFWKPFVILSPTSSRWF